MADMIFRCVRYSTHDRVKGGSESSIHLSSAWIDTTWATAAARPAVSRAETKVDFMARLCPPMPSSLYPLWTLSEASGQVLACTCLLCVSAAVRSRFYSLHLRREGARQRRAIFVLFVCVKNFRHAREPARALSRSVRLASETRRMLRCGFVCEDATGAKLLKWGHRVIR